MLLILSKPMIDNDVYEFYERDIPSSYSVNFITEVFCRQVAVIDPNEYYDELFSSSLANVVYLNEKGTISALEKKRKNDLNALIYKVVAETKNYYVVEAPR